MSIDSKKKEIIGLFANVGKEWRPNGINIEVNFRDFQGSQY
jgi:hypothetical protein